MRNARPDYKRSYCSQVPMMSQPLLAVPPALSIARDIVLHRRGLCRQRGPRLDSSPIPVG